MARNRRYVHFQKLLSDRGIINPEIACMQFVVNNPTAFVVKIGMGLTFTTDYDFIIKAQSLFVSPVFNFPNLFYVVDSFAAGYVMPTVFCYDRWLGTPGITVLS